MQLEEKICLFTSTRVRVRVACLLLLYLQEEYHAVARHWYIPYFGTRNIFSGTVIQGSTLFSSLIEHIGPIYVRKFLEIWLNSQKDFTRKSETEVYGCGILLGKCAEIHTCH